MTYVVRRPGGRWEIRESVVTPRGPRARSLATFRMLSPSVLDRAEQAATTRFDRQKVVMAARRVGAVVVEDAADRAGRDLLIELAAGRVPRPGLRRLLLDGLARAGPTPEVEAGDSIAGWVGASPGDRGRALRELLDLGDRLPSSRRGPLRFPPLAGADRG
jgi:hypothetical protein